MSNTSLDLLNLYPATTLRERSTSSAIKTIANTSAASLSEKAEYRLAHWQKYPFFANQTRFSQRLQNDELDEITLRHILAIPTDGWQQYFVSKPTWMQQFANTFAQFSTLPHVDESSEQITELGFLNLVNPWLLEGCSRLEAGIQAMLFTYPAMPFTAEKMVEIFSTALSERLKWIISRTLVLELNVARVEDRLLGTTAQERFHYFCTQLYESGTARKIFAEYPVLARLITEQVECWLEVNLQFLQRLCQDWTTICNKFFSQHEPGLLVDIQSGVGDSHRGGHTVFILTFENQAQLVYKPHSLAIDSHFQELLNWLNQRLADQAGQTDHCTWRFESLQLLQRCDAHGDYGWVEFVKSKSCIIVDEVERFYQRLGGYLALLYAIQATDFHNENLIAYGEHPMLIDLEALFHPNPENSVHENRNTLATQEINYSVLRVGLLPQRAWLTEEGEGVELSGLSGEEGQLTPHPVPYWEDGGTDQMRLERKHIEMPGANNRPTLNGKAVQVLDYTEHLLKGFTIVYRTLLNNIQGLLAKNGPLAQFTNDESRVVLRSTHTYARLLQESYHPDFLRDALDRDRFFDYLWSAVEEQPYLSRVIRAEQDDLWRGDIPLFTTRPASHDLWTSNGQLIRNFFVETGMESARQRIQQLSEDDLRRQIWFIRASLAALNLGEQEKHWSHYQLDSDTQPATKEQLLASARMIGDRLEMLALCNTSNTSAKKQMVIQSATWVGLTLVNKKAWALLPLGSDLYDGLSGIAIFLAQLGALTDDERYTHLAKAALSSTRKYVEQNRTYITTHGNIGAFGDLGGFIYALAYLGGLWQEPLLLDEAETWSELISVLIKKDQIFDIIGGSAGCINALLVLYQQRPTSHVFNLLCQCGDWLLTHAQPQTRGLGWQSKSMDTEALAGFSHGSAGIALALLRLYNLLGEPRFYQTAIQAFIYERSLFSASAGNWPDLRDLDAHQKMRSVQGEANNAHVDEKNKQNSTFMFAWCHGAPGIGLGRVSSLRYISNESERLRVREEIHTAVQTTLINGFGRNHSLCHGDLGNLELLLQVGLQQNDQALLKKVYQIAGGILSSIEQQGPLCGVPFGVETPGLMTGLAGIGYGLLRLAAPERVPSVLTLEPLRM